LSGIGKLFEKVVISFIFTMELIPYRDVLFCFTLYKYAYDYTIYKTYLYMFSFSQAFTKINNFHLHV